jgi:N-alpha-acetyltransferase 40
MSVDNMDETELLQRAVEAKNVLLESNPECGTVFFDGEEFCVSCVRSNDLGKKQKDFIMDTLRENMKEMYIASGWGWNESDKRKEVFSSKSRFLTLAPLQDPFEIKAYVIFRFEWDDEDEPEYPVAYCYELQVSVSFQKKGAGKVLMDILHNIAKFYKMKKTLLTVFKCNTAAINFYNKNSYVIDNSSPSKFDEDECYEILSFRTC